MKSSLVNRKTTVLKLFLLFIVLIQTIGIVLMPSRVCAAGPQLSELQNLPLRDVYQAGKPYSLELLYKDPNGDRPKKMQFIDQGPSGKIIKDAKVVGTDYRAGVTLDWDIEGFEQGQHSAYFLVSNATGTTRYQRSADPNGFYTFVVESLITKLIIMAIGLLVGLLFVPFIVYVLARSLNKAGDPSAAARVGLLLGILGCTALGIQQFSGFYNNSPLVWGIAIVAGLALMIVVFTRR